VEHLGRGTAESVDALLVVVEPGQRSVHTARAIQPLAQDLGIKQILVVGNKVRDEADRAFIRAQLADLDVVGFISYRESIVRADLEGRSIFDLDQAVVDEVREIKANLERLLDRGAPTAR
jgi:CO dehydrogenase maturation factor